VKITRAATPHPHCHCGNSGANAILTRHSKHEIGATFREYASVAQRGRRDALIT
jgi:hypothetical protein